jgi:hypothetical protein
MLIEISVAVCCHPTNSHSVKRILFCIRIFRPKTHAASESHAPHCPFQATRAESPVLLDRDGRYVRGCVPDGLARVEDGEERVGVHYRSERDMIRSDVEGAKIQEDRNARLPSVK